LDITICELALKTHLSSRLPVFYLSQMMQANASLKQDHWSCKLTHSINAHSLHSCFI